MDIQIINLILLVLAIFLLILTIFKVKSNKIEIDQDSLVDKISLNLVQNQAEETSKVVKNLNDQNQSQSQLLNQNLQLLEQRFGKVQVGITQGLSSDLVRVQENIAKTLNEQLKGMQDVNTNNFQLLSKTNHEKLSQIQLEVEKRLDENLAKNLKAFGEVRENLGQMQNTAKRMIDSTKSVDKLNSIFERTASKSFGDFGEKYLENLLTENLSTSSWNSQVTIPGGADKIDFIITMDGKRIGIDSKFPVTKYRDYIEATMENKEKAHTEYLKQVMLMAKSISEKYNKTDYLDVTLIYLPSDSMYNDVVSSQKVSEYLAKIKVSPTSPNTIFPLIQTLSLYQQKMQISQNAETIIKGLQIVKKSMDAFQSEFRKLGDKLRTAQDNYDKAGKSLNIFEKEVVQLESSDMSKTSNKNLK